MATHGHIWLASDRLGGLSHQNRSASKAPCAPPCLSLARGGFDLLLPSQMRFSLGVIGDFPSSFLGATTTSLSISQFPMCFFRQALRGIKW
jgi:hypothetical protein